MLNRTLTFRLDVGLLNDITTISKANNRNASIVIRDALIKYLEAEGVSWSKRVMTKYDDAHGTKFEKKLSIKVDKELLDKFKAKAAKEDLKKSLFVRSVIREFLDKNK